MVRLLGHFNPLKWAILHCKGLFWRVFLLDNALECNYKIWMSMNLTFKSKLEDSAEIQEAEFKENLLAFGLWLKGQGVNVRAFGSDSFNKFRLLTPEARWAAIGNFKLYGEMLQSVLSEGQGVPVTGVQLLWHAVKRLGLIPPPDLFDKVTDDDVVEIYNSAFIQVFRNFKFFEISSYSLADVSIYEWRELYYRDPTVTGEIASLGIKVFKGELTGVVDTQIRPHILEETFSPELFKMRMRQKYFAPLIDSTGQVQAVVATSEVEVVEMAKATKHRLSLVAEL